MRCGASMRVAIIACIALATSAALAAPIAIKSGALPVGENEVAQWSTLYPNPLIGPDMCAFEKLGIANTVGVHNIPVPNTSEVIFLELANAGHPIIRDANVGARFNIRDLSDWQPVASPESVFCAGHTVTAEGRIVVVGGHVAYDTTARIQGQPPKPVNYTAGLTGVRMFDGATVENIERSVTMSEGRWYPSALQTADDRVFIAGGVVEAGNNYRGTTSAEVFDPADPTASPLPQYFLPEAYLSGFSGKPFYPLMWALPTGHIFMFGDNSSCIMNHHTGECAMEADPAKPGSLRLVSPPPRPDGVSSTYPFTASAVMAPLLPDGANRVSKAEFIFFGGSRKADHPGFYLEGKWKEGFGVTALASRLSHRITVSWSRATPDAPWQYSFSNWTTEDMGYPRVMPDATLLPNGDVVLMSGAQAGVAGYPEDNVAQSNYPAFWATLYQTLRPRNRYTLLCGTDIPRLYHASASLTREGTILVGGADRNDYLQTMPGGDLPWFNGTANEREVYDVEEFKPPYVFDTAHKPEIMAVANITMVNGSADSTPELPYNTRFSIAYKPADPEAADVNVTTVTLVAPSATTHSVNMHQRVIRLRVAPRTTEGVLEALTPLDPFTAPPGYYMLFLSNVKTYGTGAWVKLVDTTGAGKEVPKP